MEPTPPEDECVIPTLEVISPQDVDKFQKSQEREQRDEPDNDKNVAGAASATPGRDSDVDAENATRISSGVSPQMMDATPRDEPEGAPPKEFNVGALRRPGLRGHVRKSRTHDASVSSTVPVGSIRKTATLTRLVADGSDASQAMRSLSMRTLLELSRLDSSEKRFSRSSSYAEVERNRASERSGRSAEVKQSAPDVSAWPLILHVDINKTITMSDTVMNKSVEYTIRECVAATFWGTIKYPDTERGPTMRTLSSYGSHDDSPHRLATRPRYGRGDFLDKPGLMVPKTLSSISLRMGSVPSFLHQESVSRQFSGVIGVPSQTFSRGPRWMWDGTKPRQRPEGDYVSYLQFCRQVLSDKEAQRSSVRSFDLVQHLHCRKLMEELVSKTVVQMTMPKECQGEQANAAGLSGDWLNMFPSFFELIASLQESGRTFAVVFRSFGNDLGRVQVEWNAFCEARHPVYAELLKKIGPMDGTQPNVPDRRIHVKDSHTLYRDATSPILALGVSTNGIFEGAWDQWARSKAEEDTRDGRTFLRELTDTVEGYEELRAWMRSLALSCKSAAIKDDFAWWHHCGEISTAGKLMFIIPDIAQVFFDDNAGEGSHVDDAKIVDCRYGDPLRTITHALGDGAFYAQVSPIDAILHKSYFIKLLETCQRNQRHCWLKIHSAVQQPEESEATIFQNHSSSFSDPPGTPKTPPPIMVSKTQSQNSGGHSALALAFRGLPTDPMLGNAIEVHTIEALTELLSTHGINVSVFGRKQFKTIDALFHEVQTGRCILEAFTDSDDGRDSETAPCLRRVLQVVLVKVLFRDKILVETHEQMVDGRLRSRNGFLPGAKKRKNEKFEDCVRRWMVNEVQFDPDLLCAVDEKGTFEEYEEEQSISYPLRCRYHRYTVCYSLDENSMDDELMERMGLPIGTMFTTTEKKIDKTSGAGAGPNVRNVVHFWSWYQTACWYASQQKPPSSTFPNMMQCFDVVFAGNPRRRPYQRLLLQMFQTMEMSKLTGGLSGSLVLKVQPIDTDTNRRLDPCIVKLDKADAISHEVVNSKRVYTVLSDRAARILSNALFFTDPETNVEYGAFKLELAAGCWQIPEVASSVLEDLLSTMRDLVVYECESHHPMFGDVPQVPSATTRSADSRRPFGNTDSVIYELMGPGGMLRNMQQEGLLRSATTLLDSFARGMLGKDTQYNPFWHGPVVAGFTPDGAPTTTTSTTSVGRRMRPLLAAFARKYFSADELPDVRANVLQLVEDWKSMEDEYTPLIGLAHGDLNMRNVLIDAMDAVWLIDFAFSRDLPLCWDLAKVEISFLFEYSVLPVSPQTLLMFAGHSREEWQANKAADWLDVEEEVALTLLDALHHTGTDSSTIDLDHACTHAAQKTIRACPIYTARKLRARLCNEDDEKKVFHYVAQLIPALLEGTSLPDLLSDAPKRVLSMEENFSHKSCVAPLAHLVRHIMRFRRLFMDHWARVLQKYRDEKQQRVSREEGWESGNRLVKGDVAAVQLWIALLQESHRLLGYFDIPPWHKTWVVFFVQKLVELIRAQVLPAIDGSDPTQAGVQFWECLDFDSSIAELDQSLEVPRDHCFLNMNSTAVEHLIAAKESIRALYTRPRVSTEENPLVVPHLRQQQQTPGGRRRSITANVRQVHLMCNALYGSFTLNGDGGLCEVAPRSMEDTCTICCPLGSLVRVPVADDNGAMSSAGPAWRSGVVTRLGADGLYTVQYDTHIDLAHSASDHHPNAWSDAEWGDCAQLDPQLHNHLICPAVHYLPDTELLFYKMCGRMASVVVVGTYKHLHCVQIKESRRASQEFRRRASSKSSKESSAHASPEYWVTLLPENHCRAMMPYVNFEEQLIKYRMFSKARYSSTMDVISGESIDVLGSVSFDIARARHEETNEERCSVGSSAVGVVGDTCGLLCFGGPEASSSLEDEDLHALSTADKQNNWTLLCDFVMSPRESIIHGHMLCGVPGSGKSCIIRKLMMYCLNRSKQALPVFIRPINVARRIAALPAGTDAPSGLLLLCWYIELIHGENSPQYTILCQAMSAHRVVFFIDGIDEVEEDLRPVFFRCLEELVALDHRVVVTRRSGADMQLFHDHLDVGLLIAWTILPFSPRAKFELVKSRLRAPHWTEEDARTCLTFLSTFYARLDVEERMKWHIPLMISVLILYWREKVKKNASELHSSTARVRLSSESAKMRAPASTLIPRDALYRRQCTPTQEFEYDIREVYRVALDALLKRVHGTNQADRHAVAVQVEEFKALLGCIAWNMNNESRNAFTEVDALRAEENIFDAEVEPAVWFGLKRLIHKGNVPLLQYVHNNKPRDQTYRFAFYSFSEFLAHEWEKRRVLETTDDTLGYFFGRVTEAECETEDGGATEGRGATEQEEVEGGFVNSLYHYARSIFRH
eukprot:GEMP01000257.1.p1 GENE.GEMP01000257.1~~GEMP01000257.1.p1  ORF type:complete len:2389 (+),score=650.99 GEMP01000257.1:176-7342(+)